MAQPRFFDIDERSAKLTWMGDPLVGLNSQIDWEAFRADLNRVHQKDRKSNAGAKPIDVVLMFKLLVLQQRKRPAAPSINPCTAHAYFYFQMEYM
jgi:IS5 family transposase